MDFGVDIFTFVEIRLLGSAFLLEMRENTSISARNDGVFASYGGASGPVFGREPRGFQGTHASPPARTAPGLRRRRRSAPPAAKNQLWALPRLPRDAEASAR